MFCKAAASDADFELILLKTMFSCFWLGSAVFSIIFLSRTFSSLFVTKLHFWRSILPKECYGLLATKLSCFEPHVTQKKRFAFLCLKYAACSFIVGKICFGLFAVKLGCFRCYFTGKRLSASLQGVTLILLDPFSKTIGKHVSVCWQRNWKFRTLSQKKMRFSLSPKSTLLQASYYQKYVLVSWHQNWVLWASYRKKQRFCFLFAKTRCTHRTVCSP